MKSELGRGSGGGGGKGKTGKNMHARDDSLIFEKLLTKIIKYSGIHIVYSSMNYLKNSCHNKK